MKTPYENYEVVNIHGRYVEIRCKICHQDTELWPNVIKTEKSNYLGGHKCCGCAKSCRWKPWQLEILLNRDIKNTNYTFIGFEKYPPKSNTPFIMSCSICSKDTELFHEGDIVGNRHQLRTHKFCGCAVKYVWSERQNILRATRKCKELGIKFKGWDGEYKGVETKVKVRHPDSNCDYCGSKLHMFLKWTTDELARFAGIPDNLVTKAGGKLKVLGFSGSYSGNNKQVLVTCSICSQDKELFPSPFKSTLWELRVGKYPCICDYGYKSWSKHEYQVRIKRKLAGLPVTWDGVLPDNPCAATKIKLTYHHHPLHPWDTTSLDYLFHSTKLENYGCARCAEGIYGYYDTKRKDDDTLYIMLFDDSYIKIGRSFQIDRRLAELKVDSGASEVRILKVFKGNHEFIYEVEQACHKYLTDLGYYHEDSIWTVESFNKESYDEAIEFIRNYINPHK